MPLGQIDSPVNDGAIYHEEYKVFLAVLQESTQRPVALLWRDAARSPTFRRERSGHTLSLKQR